MPNRKLRQAREAFGWTQKDVAEKINLPDVRTLRRWESGESLPSLHYRAKLRELFHMTVDELGLETDISTDNQSSIQKKSTEENISSDLLTDYIPRRLAGAKDQNRRRFLKRVRMFWIEGVLKQSLYNDVLIPLDLQERPDVVVNPWQLVLQETGRITYPLPSNKRIIDVYDETDGELLILGEPGAGKTTLLLELARNLLDRAEIDEHYPLPVVLNLSSWSVKQYPLSMWLLEELMTKYQIPIKHGQVWIDSDELILLLDGLDEVAPEHRVQCVHAINVYRQEHGLASVVVCSRIADYLALPTRLLLQQGVVIKPLTESQVNDYLAQISGKKEALSAWLQENEDLKELMANPLMLNILTSTYPNRAIENFPIQSSLSVQRQQVFEDYVKRMLNRRSGYNKNYKLDQTKRWLVWLAKQLEQHNQTIFYLERMQMDWLFENQLSYPPSKMLMTIVFGVLFGGVFGVLFGPLAGLIFKPLAGLILALIGGVLVGIVSVLEEILPTETVVWSWKGLWPHLPLSLLMGSMLGFLTETVYKLGLPFFFLCIASLTLGEGYFAIQKVRELGKLDIQYWWENRSDQRMEVLRFVLIVVLTTSLSTGFFVWFGSGLRSVQFLEQLYGTQYAQNILCTFAGSLFGLVYGLLKSLRCSKLDERTFVRPNQGIKHSLQNSLVAGSIVFFLFGLIYYFFFALFIWMYSLNVTYILLIDAIITGAVFGLIAAFVIGGDACIKHIILRLLLWRVKHIPWNYSHFLDYATERILLRKVGGGYIFIHRLLLEYFASK